MGNTGHIKGKKQQVIKADLKPVKISIIGVGAVGSTTAYTLLLSGMAAEIVLIDINERKAEGESMDLNHAAPLTNEAKIYVGDYADLAGSSIVIITGGANQKPGQTRMELVAINAKIIEGIVPKISENAPDSILLVATNPVDVLTYISYKLSGFPANRVIGSGTIIDTARFKYLLGKHFKIDPDSINAYIIGEHGDSELAVWSLANIAGLRLRDYCKQSNQEYDEKAMQEIFEKTKNAAYDIINRKGFTAYGIASGLTRIVEAILRDEGTLITVSTVDEYCGEEVALSIPAQVGRSGAKHIFKMLLDAKEEDQLKASGKNIKSVATKLGYS